MTVPAFSRRTEYVPNLDDDYRFDPGTMMVTLAGFAHNRRVMIEGYLAMGSPRTSCRWPSGSTAGVSTPIWTVTALIERASHLLWSCSGIVFQELNSAEPHCSIQGFCLLSVRQKRNVASTDERVSTLWRSNVNKNKPANLPIPTR